MMSTLERPGTPDVDAPTGRGNGVNGGIALIGLIILTLLPVSPAAQYFGRNKVQYEQWNFKVLDTKHFGVYFYPSADSAAVDGARMAERWYDRYASFFEYKLKQRQPLILYANQADFEQTNVVSGIIHQGTGGVTEGLRGRIVLPFSGIYKENDHVIGHELVHAFQFDMMKENSRGMPSLNRLPLWFVEGMAEYLSLGSDYPLTDMWLRDAVLYDFVPSIDDMSRDPRYFPYRWGQAFWIFIGEGWGDDVIPPMLKNTLSGRWDETVKELLGVKPDSLSDLWKQWVTDRCRPQLKGKSHPDDIGQRVFEENREGTMHLAPSISPDGRMVAFVSQRDIFTMDLYLADVEKGKVIKKLSSTNSNAHFDALRFINASGAWSPDGKQIAYAVYKDGDNAIVIFDVESRDVVRTISVKHVHAITQIAWSPDGHFLCFSGSYGGLSDLYLYNLESESLEQLTADRYADVQPTWSPDGRTIAFVTDRGAGTNFEDLKFRPVQIGFFDLETRNIKLLAMEPDVKHVSPQYSPDGTSLYFISDPDDFSDVYRYSFGEDKFYRVTTAATGISGLTPLSPALTVASGTGTMIATVFEQTGYVMHKLNTEEAAEPTFSEPLAGVTDTTNEYAETTTVDRYLHDPETGLPATRPNKVHDYHPTLSLLWVGQPYVGVAADRFGTSLGGGASMLFGDMLGNRLLGVAAQVSGGIKDVGGQAYYQNKRHRTNWGVVAGHIPYQTIGVSHTQDTVSLNGREVQAIREDLIRERTFVDRASLIADYPLSRNQRFELAGGFTHLSYDVEVDAAYVVGGVIVREDKVELPARSPLNLFQSSLAFVGDYSYNGFTSPVRGHRYRLEVEPTFGGLRYLTILADYREYFFFNPVTLAFRGLHLGRYLKDSDSDRLSSLFLGYHTLVRGYGAGDISLSECQHSTNDLACPVFDRLVGSRIAVFNAELRLPLFGTGEYGLVDFSYLPTELVAFFDAGVAWTKYEKPKFKFARRSTERIPVFSTGLATRVSVGGYIVMQVYWAFPFQRPDKTSQFGFVIAPGW
jgi:Tol biopolymer transport system component